MARIHIAVPCARHGASPSAQPPLAGVQPTSQWYAERMARPRPWWRRLLRRAS